MVCFLVVMDLVFGFELYLLLMAPVFCIGIVFGVNYWNLDGPYWDCYWDGIYYGTYIYIWIAFSWIL
jgi:hypothetical protein